MTTKNQLLREAVERYVALAEKRRAELGVLSAELEEVVLFGKRALAQPAEGGKPNATMTPSESTALVTKTLIGAQKANAILRLALKDLHAFLDPDDWAGEVSMHDYIDAALKKADQAYTAPPVSQEQADDCARSHPHEHMNPMCELRTQIARLTNENSRLKASQEQAQQPQAQAQQHADELPGMWHTSDIVGGATDFERPTRLEQIDRSAAVNLARNLIDVRDCKGVTQKGVKVLCDAILRMDAALLAITPQAQAQELPDGLSINGGQHD